MNDWTVVCREKELIAGTGVCALLGDDQVAIFKTRKDSQLYAISNYDPIGKANVLSRGIIGSIGDAVVVASPLYKQHFNLVSGQCIENQEMFLKIYPIRVFDGQVQLKNV